MPQYIFLTLLVFTPTTLLESYGVAGGQATIASSRGAITLDKTFARVSSSGLVIGASDQSLQIRGVNFSADRLVPTGSSNWIAGGTCSELAANTDATPVTNWYQEKHLGLIKGIGFNTVRLNMSYRIFEDDATAGTYKSSAWTFLDSYVSWAKTQGVYLILDMHVPPGGYQPSSGGGSCLWDTASNQTRLADLWKAIATRYASETVIAAYDLLNEPTPTGASLDEATSKYQTLMQSVADAIRTVDTNHMLIVERINWVFNSDGSSPLSNITSSILQAFKAAITDSSGNTMYDFHYYNPSTYALQNEGSNPDDGNYPDTATNYTALDGTSHVLDSSYLSYELNLELNGNSGGTMFAGEWGPNVSTFTTSSKGGSTYSTDLMGLMDAQLLNWTYYSMFNLYDVSCCDTGYTCCSGDNATTENTTVTSVFKSALAGNIPTMTQWGIIILIILILGTGLYYRKPGSAL